MVFPETEEFMMQHHDHCILTANGQNWFIDRMNGMGHVVLVRVEGTEIIYSIIDLSKVRWEEYYAACEAKMGIKP